MSAVTKIETSKLTPAQRIDEIAAGAMELFKHRGSFEAELAVANAMSELRAALTPEVMKPIMSLMNTDIGFRTDRDPKVTPRDKEGHPTMPYSVEVVRDCVAEALLRGFHVVGNEFNIIAGRFYAAKNGFRRKVTTYEGVTDFKDNYDVPRLNQEKGGAIVKCRAAWKKKGIEDSLEREFPIRVNAFMGSDAILGKAQRKLLATVHDRLAGVITPEGDAGEDIVPAPAAPQPNFGPKVVDAEIVESKTLAVQQELAKIVTGNSYNFDDFIQWGLESGNLTSQQVDAYNSFDDLPDTLAKRFVTAKAGLLRGMAILKGGK